MNKIEITAKFKPKQTVYTLNHQENKYNEYLYQAKKVNIVGLTAFGTGTLNSYIIKPGRFDNTQSEVLEFDLYLNKTDAITAAKKNNLKKLKEKIKRLTKWKKEAIQKYDKELKQLNSLIKLV